MPASLPLMPGVTVSVAVRDWAPAVLRVALKVAVPPVMVKLAGSTAWGSLLVI